MICVILSMDVLRESHLRLSHDDNMRTLLFILTPPALVYIKLSKVWFLQCLAPIGCRKHWCDRLIQMFILFYFFAPSHSVGLSTGWHWQMHKPKSSNEQIISTHNSSFVLDRWICAQKCMNVSLTCCTQIFRFKCTKCSTVSQTFN